MIAATARRFGPRHPAPKRQASGRVAALGPGWHPGMGTTGPPHSAPRSLAPPHAETLIRQLESPR